MNRRDVLIGSLAAPISLGLSGQVMGAHPDGVSLRCIPHPTKEWVHMARDDDGTLHVNGKSIEADEDKYWEAQWQISELEDDRQT